jgi:GNAT superfamily N-acetyltransferase
MIISANISDAKTLTEIALNSKAFWNYSAEQLKNWTEELAVSEKMIQEMIVYKFIFDNKTVGFYILNPLEQKSIALEFLFVLPAFIRKGFGKQLMNHAFQKAIALNNKEITLLADPNAVSFYKKNGFEVIAKKESTIPNRFLPVMKRGLV